MLDEAPASRATRPALDPAALVRLFHESWKYFLASIAALGVDYGLLVGLTELVRIPYLVSAAIGFCAGLAVNYILSVTLVFKSRRLDSRWIEFVGFLVIGAVGLALNEFLMKAFVEAVGLGYAIAKIPATAIGFVFNFVTRKVLLFSRAN